MIDSTLASLMQQAHAEGSSIVTLRALAEEASDAGARRALHRLGLADADADTDVRDLRALLEAWRAAKRSVLHAVIRWLLHLLLTGLLIAAALQLKQIDTH